MKRRTFQAISLILAIGWISFLTACSLLGVSVQARVDQFVDDINVSDRSNVYLNFHPDILDYAGIQLDDFWDILPDGGIPYTITAPDTSDPSDVTFTIFDNGVLSWNVRFVMMKSDNDWMISKMYMRPTPNPPTDLIVD